MAEPRNVAEPHRSCNARWPRRAQVSSVGDLPKRSHLRDHPWTARPGSPRPTARSPLADASRGAVAASRPSSGQTAIIPRARGHASRWLQAGGSAPALRAVVARPRPLHRVRKEGFSFQARGVSQGDGPGGAMTTHLPNLHAPGPAARAVPFSERQRAGAERHRPTGLACMPRYPARESARWHGRRKTEAWPI